jgi:hypothetical protein
MGTWSVSSISPPSRGGGFPGRLLRLGYPMGPGTRRTGSVPAAQCWTDRGENGTLDGHTWAGSATGVAVVRPSGGAHLELTVNS